jgi:hypothetical protein
MDVGDRRHEDAPRRPRGEIAVGFPEIRPVDSEGPPGALRPHPLPFDVPRPRHALAELVVSADDHEHVLRVRGRRLQRVGVARQDEGFQLRIPEGHEIGHLRPETVPHDAHPPGVHERQGAEIGHGGLAAVGPVEIRRPGVAGNARVPAADRVDVEHDEPPSRDLDRVGVARLPVVLVAVDVDDPGGGALPAGRQGLVELGADRDAADVGVVRVRHPHPAEIPLRLRGQEDGRRQDGETGNQNVKRPPAMGRIQNEVSIHGNLHKKGERQGVEGERPGDASACRRPLSVGAQPFAF